MSDVYEYVSEFDAGEPASPRPSNRARANRANAEHSTGPITAEGKARSSMNALKHGLTAKALILPNEDRGDFDRHLRTWIDHYKPIGPAEVSLVHRLAGMDWRLRRMVPLDTQLYTASEGESCSLDQQSRARNSLSSCEQRLTRAFKIDLQQLLDQQKARREAEAKDLDKAAQLALHDEAEGLTFDPTADGFVFSKEDIQAFINREKRAHQASDSYWRTN